MPAGSKSRVSTVLNKLLLSNYKLSLQQIFPNYLSRAPWRLMLQLPRLRYSDVLSLVLHLLTESAVITGKSQTRGFDVLTEL